MFKPSDSRYKYTAKGKVLLPNPNGGKLKKAAERAAKQHGDIRNHLTPRSNSDAATAAAADDTTDETQDEGDDSKPNGQPALAGHDDSNEEESDADDETYDDSDATVNSDPSAAAEEHNLRRDTLDRRGSISMQETQSLLMDQIIHCARKDEDGELDLDPLDHYTKVVVGAVQRKVTAAVKEEGGEPATEGGEDETEGDETEDDETGDGNDSEVDDREVRADDEDGNEERRTGGIEGILEETELTEEEITAIYEREARKDPKLQPESWADRKLISVYGDTIHQNDGTHLHGLLDAAEDMLYQDLYKRVASVSVSMYEVYRNGVGAKFLNMLATEWEKARVGRMNSERPLIFPACILVRKPGISKSADIKRLIQIRLDLWEKGEILSLIKAVEDAGQTGRADGAARPMGANGIDESVARRYASTFLNGKHRQAVRNVTDRGQGGLYKPSDRDSKTGEPVIDVLRSKFPQARIPMEDGSDLMFQIPDDFEKENAAAFIYVAEDTIQERASKLHGAAGPSGVDAIMLKAWLTRHGCASQALRTELAKWAEMLATLPPTYSKIRALNHTRLLAVDKEPGVRPIGCGEIWMRLFAGVILDQCKERARQACNNVQLCAGLQAGIEGATHAMLEVWPELAGWFNTAGVEGNNEDEGGNDETSGGEEDGTSQDDLEPEELCPATEERQEPTHPSFPEFPILPKETESNAYVPGKGFGVLLVDARNAFNELNRYSMLWEVYHRCPPIARFAFNRYRHHNLCFVRNEMGEPPIIITSEEGITQGCCLSMVCYGIALMPLAEHGKDEIGGLLEPWYADDLAGLGEAEDNARLLRLLYEKGPDFGYFPEAEKSHYICKSEDEAAARAAFAAGGYAALNYVRNRRYLGGTYGDAAEKELWVKKKVEEWVHCVEVLAKCAYTQPQTAYSGFVLVLQNEWTHLSRIVPNVGPLLAPIETAIREKFIPALFGISPSELTGELRHLLSHSVKKAGLAIRFPVEQSVHCFNASRSAVNHLVDTLVQGRILDLGYHRRVATTAKEKAREALNFEAEYYLTQWGLNKPGDKRRLERICNSGVWLTVIPNRLNGSILSAEEFRDNLRLRYNLKPLDMPDLCDGCGAKLDVEHALHCKVGGLVHCRHNDVTREFGYMCGLAFTNGAVDYEPYIYTSGQQSKGTEAEAAAATATTTTQQHQATDGSTPVTTHEDRGDIIVNNFWQRQRPCVFDTRITDADARSYRNKAPSAVLRQHEKEKIRKYKKACLERRRDFTPLCYTADGMAGREARNAERRLGMLLSEKWQRQHSQMVFFVRSRMSLALVRANSLLIRGSREKRTHRIRPLIDDGPGMTNWHTWSGE